MLILGIESSCDETGAAIVADGRTVLSNALASQAAIHAKYGGVVPEVAAREQLLSIIPVIDAALQNANMTWNKIDAIAATYGPGLAGPLLVGLTAAKSLAFARQLPFIGINHLEAHIYANWLYRITTASDNSEPKFPLLSLLVSGAHTELILIRSHGDYQLLGQTKDDAAGEAFDKVARLLGLSYPGGPSIQAAASQWSPQTPLPYKLPRAWLRGTADFSFSGVKTAVVSLVRQIEASGEPINVPAIAAAFQEAVVDVLATKTIAAARAEHVAEVALAGGVAANLALRNRLARDLKRYNIPFRVPTIEWCTDNAAMIAGAAYFHIQRGDVATFDIDVNPHLALPLGSQ